jgi:toxin CcdB
VARFDVYRHPDAALRRNTPFLLDIQNDYISSVETRIVIPLRTAAHFGLRMRDLNPVLTIGGTDVVLDAAALAAFPAAELRSPVDSLKAQAELIVNALDTLFGAY